MLNITFSDTLSLLAIIISMWSWRVSKNQGVLLASRNEAFVYLDSLHSIIDDIESIAENYWLDRAQFEARKYEFMVLSKLYLIRCRLIALKRRGVYIKDETLIQMRQSLTLDNNTSTDVGRTLKCIITKANDFRHELDVNFTTQFPVHDRKVFFIFNKRV